MHRFVTPSRKTVLLVALAVLSFGVLPAHAESQRATKSTTIPVFAPAFGIGCAIGRVSPDQAMPWAWRYRAAPCVALIVIAAVPWLSVGFL